MELWEEDMRLVLAMVAVLGLSAGSAGAVSTGIDPCDDPESSDCPSSPNYDPWWYEGGNGPSGPTDGADPVSGPTCQNQIGDESLPPEQQNDGCILPGGPDSPG